MKRVYYVSPAISIACTVFNFWNSHRHFVAHETDRGYAALAAAFITAFIAITQYFSIRRVLRQDRELTAFITDLNKGQHHK